VAHEQLQTQAALLHFRCQSCPGQSDFPQLPVCYQPKFKREGKGPDETQVSTLSLTANASCALRAVSEWEWGLPRMAVGVGRGRAVLSSLG